MSHNHPVYDDDRRFVIDPTKRLVIATENNVPALFQYDHNSEYITFVCDRFVEGHDLSLSDKAEIHYNNAASGGRNISKGVYLIEDLKIDDTDKSKIVFTWVVSSNATKYAGPLNFIVAFTCTDEGDILYRWNTGINTFLSISPSINNGEAVEQAYADVLEAWQQLLFGVGDTEEARMLQISQQQQDAIALKGSQVAASIPESYAELQAMVDSLTEDDYIPQTTMTDNSITEVFDDGHYKVTTVNGQTITEKWYTAANVLTKTKTIIISQNGVSETITTA